MSTNHIDYIGPHTLDLTALQGKLVDLPEGGMQGLRGDQPGFQPMVLAFAEAMPLHGAAAGIPQDVYDHFVMCNGTITQIDERLAIAEKQIEVLRESRAFYVDARQNDLSLMVDAMRSRAQRRKDASLLVPFGAVLKYIGQIAVKGWRTRRTSAQPKEQPPAQQVPPPATPPAQPAQPA